MPRQARSTFNTTANGPVTASSLCPDGKPHHWKIDDPDKAVNGLLGSRCKRRGCNQKRTYPANPEMKPWNMQKGE